MWFVNTVYRENAQIIKVSGFHETINYEDFCIAAKNFYKIKNEINFYDTDTGINIPSEILVEFVTDKKSSTPKWILGISDKIEKINGLTIVEDISNKVTVEDLVDTPESATPVNILEGISSEVTHIYRTISLHTSEEFKKNQKVNPIIKRIFPSFSAITEIKDLDFSIIYANFLKTKILENCDRTQIAKLIIKIILQQHHNLE